MGNAASNSKSIKSKESEPFANRVSRIESHNIIERRIQHDKKLMQILGYNCNVNVQPSASENYRAGKNSSKSKVSTLRKKAKMEISPCDDFSYISNSGLESTDASQRENKIAMIDEIKRNAKNLFFFRRKSRRTMKSTQNISSSNEIYNTSEKQVIERQEKNIVKASQQEYTGNRHNQAQHLNPQTIGARETHSSSVPKGLSYKHLL